jgi:hypothetical protein
VRMGIVPWGVFVHTRDAPRILRWAAVKRMDVAIGRRRPFSGRFLPSQVVVATERDRFIGATLASVPLGRLVTHLEAYAEEQSRPIALDLDGVEAAENLEPECETLFGVARVWLETAGAAARLDFPPAGYRGASSHMPSGRAVDVLRGILRDRTPKLADPRAFAAVVAAEVHAVALLPELVVLTQCPHPVVAAVARQAALKLGADRTCIGTLDEVAPFLFERDRFRLDAWGRSAASG